MNLSVWFKFIWIEFKMADIYFVYKINFRKTDTLEVFCDQMAEILWKQPHPFIAIGLFETALRLVPKSPGGPIPNCLPRNSIHFFPFSFSKAN